MVGLTCHHTNHAPIVADGPEILIGTDRIYTNGAVTLRHHGQLHQIGIGRIYTGTHVLPPASSCAI
jgi:hypothetical protein